MRKLNINQRYNSSDIWILGNFMKVSLFPCFWKIKSLSQNLLWSDPIFLTWSSGFYVVIAPAMSTSKENFTVCVSWTIPSRKFLIISIILSNRMSLVSQSSTINLYPGATTMWNSCEKWFFALDSEVVLIEYKSLLCCFDEFMVSFKWLQYSTFCPFVPMQWSPTDCNHSPTKLFNH